MSLIELEKIISELKSQKLSENFTLEQFRSAVEEMAAFFPIPENAKIERVNIEGITGELIKFSENKSSSIIIYLHGGGYISGSINSYRTLACNISKISGITVLLIEYRLAPEFPFPLAIKDSIKAYNWVKQQGLPAKHIAIAGDSAGAGLALATCIMLRDRKQELPAAIVSISGWLDLNMEGKSIENKAAVDPICSLSKLQFFRNLYVPKGDFHNPLVSPLYADLKHLPPLLIQVGTEEILLDDSIRLAKKTKQYNIQAELKIWNKMIHVWHLFAPYLSEGWDAIEEIGIFLNQNLK